MDSLNQPSNITAAERFLSVTEPSNVRKTILKLYFLADRTIINNQDNEEVYFLLCFLEDIEKFNKRNQPPS